MRLATCLVGPVAQPKERRSANGMVLRMSQGPETQLKLRLRDKYVKMGKGRGVGDAPAMHNRRHRVTPCSSRLLQADSVRWCALKTNHRLGEKA